MRGVVDLLPTEVPYVHLELPLQNLLLATISCADGRRELVPDHVDTFGGLLALAQFAVRVFNRVYDAKVT
jgi:hypothetical protein